MALINPGDEVLLFEPIYGYHASMLHSLRAKTVLVPLDPPHWLLSIERVRAAITPRTRAILINTPANPTGKVFTRAELEGLAEIAIEHDLFVLSDEIYEHFVYDGAKHISPAEIPGMKERTILVSGFSKTFSVTGWRIGYLIADAKWLPAIAYFHDLLYVCAPAPLQHGVADGVEQLGPEYYRNLARDHQSKREILLAALRQAGMSPLVPEGAYYILADSSNIPGATAAQKARTLLAQTGVAAVSGSAFFRPGHGENLLRFCFAKKDADLAEARRRLTARSV
jgi:aminotransferase